MKVRCIELFSGVGSQRMALTRLMAKHPDLEVEFVAQCDIDKYAVKSYNAIHGETPNLGDISKVERLPDCDLVRGRSHARIYPLPVTRRVWREREWNAFRVVLGSRKAAYRLPPPQVAPDGECSGNPFQDEQAGVRQAVQGP